MGSCVPSEFPRRLAAEPDATAGVSFARFMEVALYDPEVGYYTRQRTRVGRMPGTDFHTAASVGPVFGELVAAAAAGLLAPSRARDHVFVELGVEPGDGGVLQGVPHPFARAEVRRLGDPPTLPARSVVFSNELFDAQPFHRVRFRAGAWRELGVAADGGGLREVELHEPSPEVAAILASLPATAAEGYRFDLPLRAVRLLDSIAAQPWQGLFLAFDYGKSWTALCESTPAGTARAYHRHTCSNELLARPGEQDLTCHVCWDWLQASLRRHGFEASTLESQESFLVHRASDALAAIVTAEAGRLSPRKQAIMQLLHPGNMGQKFQVLWALRARKPPAG